jgi:hypothetical protein
MGIEKLRLSRSKLRMEEFDKEAIAGFIVGLGLTDATSILKGVDVLYRIAREDKENYILTMDFKPYRANLELDNGVVTGIYWG